MWVADAVDDKLYAYDLASKARDASKDFDTLADAGNYQPQGIWSDGTTMWVVDRFDYKLYAYDLASRGPGRQQGLRHPGRRRQQLAAGHLVRRNHHVGGGLV